MSLFSLRLDGHAGDSLRVLLMMLLGDKSPSKAPDLPALTIFLPPLLQLSLSLRCRTFVADGSVGTGSTTLHIDWL